jgi:DNA polymerase I-like protein with 3'-5' exonuclease and polymerase domains
MSRFDSIGLFWEDVPAERTRGGQRQLGPMPEIPETGWRPPTEMPNIQHAPWISFDCETYDPELNDNGPGWARGVGHIVGISCAVPGGKWYFPMRHEVQKELNLDPDMVLRWARWAFAGNGDKIGANAQYDVGWLLQEGVELGGQILDCQHAEPLLDETSKLSLEALSRKYLHEGKDVDLLKEWCMSYYGGSEKRWRANIYRSPVTLAGPYAEQDAVLPQRVLAKQYPLLQQRNLLDLFYMECDLIRLLVDMRFQGIQINVPYVEELYEKFGVREDQRMDELKAMAGTHVRPNAPEDVARAFDNLGLRYDRTEPSERNPEGNPSFTKDFLKTVTHPFAKALIEAREMMKLRSTFLKSYLMESHVNGKVYCSFHQMSSEGGGTRTGRFSSSDPNLQNIPTRTEEGAMIRQAFIMDHGHKQVRDYDYSQIEYRMLAHFATGQGSDELRAKYNADPTLDYHNLVGSMIAMVRGLESYATKEKRGHVKNINFGVVYGVGEAHMAEMLGLSLRDAKALLQQIHGAIPFAKSTMEDLSKEVNRSGIVETILGRQSHFDLWEPSDWQSRKGVLPLPYTAALAAYGPNIMRAYLFRALNYKLQGSAAELMKKAMVRCYKEGVFKITGVPRLTVHDELFFSEPHGVPDEAWAYLKHVMETCVPGIRVPIRADFGVGPTWRDAH